MTSTADSVLDEVLSERLRQVNRLNHKSSSDDQYDEGQLARAALNYVAAACLTLALRGTSYPKHIKIPFDNCGLGLEWPWGRRFWKPGLVRRMLIKAMALLCAEVERIDRAEACR